MQTEIDSSEQELSFWLKKLSSKLNVPSLKLSRVYQA
jgi:hypothetical protein